MMEKILSSLYFQLLRLVLLVLGFQLLRLLGCFGVAGKKFESWGFCGSWWCFSFDGVVAGFQLPLYMIVTNIILYESCFIIPLLLGGGGI